MNLSKKNMTQENFIKTIMAIPIPQYLDFITCHNKPFIFYNNNYRTISRKEAIAIVKYLDENKLKYEDTIIEPHLKLSGDYYIQINNLNLPNGYVIFNEEPIAHFDNKIICINAPIV